MLAIRVYQPGGSSVLAVEEIPTPQPGPGQVRVRMLAAGVNPVDVYLREATVAKPAAWPYTPGLEGCGEIDALGDGVDGTLHGMLPDGGPALGAMVYLSAAATGTYATHALAPAAHVHRLPPRLCATQGAAIHVAYATAWRALHQRARCRPGETVLIHGASGGVGTAAVQIAVAAGLRVTATAGTPAGMAHAAAQGAAHVVDHHDDDHLAAAIAAGTPGGRGFDIVIEMLANANLGRVLPALARGGRVVVVGSRGPVEINARDLMTRDAAILGMNLTLTPESEILEAHAGLAPLLAGGVLTPVIGRRFPLAEAAAAHEAVMAPGALGKVILEISREPSPSSM